MKKILSCVMIMFIIINLGMNALAASDDDLSDDNRFYLLIMSQNGVMIYVTGDMPDFDSPEDVPWSSLSEYINYVTINEGVTNIGDYAFYNCQSLTEISIPSTVTNIGDYAFYNCQSLTKIDIPSTVTNIGDYAFYNCQSLTEISIPSTVTNIGDYAFYNDQSLTEINIPSTVSSIGKSAFELCVGITSINIPEGVKIINANTFKFCRNLKKVILPNSITEISDSAFDYCDALIDINIPDSIEQIGMDAFKQCESLEKIVIPSNLNKINKRTFKNCINLKNIIIPNKITDIESDAFSNCYNLRAVIIPDNVTNIENNSFDKSKNVFFCGVEGSYPQDYAIANNIDFYNVFLNNKMNVGEKIQLPKAICSSIISSDSNVISVSNDGILTANKAGNAVVNIKINDYEMSFSVEVVAELHRLIVINGSGSGLYTSGEQININATTSDFCRWNIQTGDSIISSNNSEKTTLTMGTSDTIVVASSYDNEIPDFCIFKQDETKCYNSEYGTNIFSGQPMLIRDGRSFISLRTISSCMGADVEYYEKNGSAYVSVVYKQSNVVFEINSTKVDICDASGNVLQTINMDDSYKPRFINGVVYLSARALHALCFASDYQLYYVSNNSSYVVFTESSVNDKEKTDMITILNTLINY